MPDLTAAAKNLLDELDARHHGRMPDAVRLAVDEVRALCNSSTMQHMPQSTKERQEALRARRLMLGQTEVRGIYLPPELHPELKAYAKKLAKRSIAAKPPAKA
jgi:hypothetical protein